MYLSCAFLSILQKLGHRLSALHKTTWSDQTKDNIKQVMTVEYTSSDEGSYEPDPDSELSQLQSEASEMGAHETDKCQTNIGQYILSLFQGESVNHLFLECHIHRNLTGKFH